MDPAAILDAIDEILNDDDGSDDEGLITLIACFVGLRTPSKSLHH